MCVCQYACAFLSCVCIFTCAYLLFWLCACMRTVFLGLFHCFSPLYFRVHSCFLRYQKDADQFLCVLYPRVIRVWSRRVNFWQNFLQNDQIFVRIRPGTLVHCSFVGFSAFLPCADGKISPKNLKKGFFSGFFSRFERNKNPRKSLEKSLKNDRRKPKNGYFLVKSGFFDLSKKPLRRFQTEFFLKSSENPTPKRLKNGFWKDFFAVSGRVGPSCV